MNNKVKLSRNKMNLIHSTRVIRTIIVLALMTITLFNNDLNAAANCKDADGKTYDIEIVVPQKVVVGEPVTLKLTGTDLDDDNDVTVEWTVGGVHGNSSTTKFTHTFTSQDTVTIKAKVTDPGSDWFFFTSGDFTCEATVDISPDISVTAISYDNEVIFTTGTKNVTLTAGVTGGDLGKKEIIWERKQNESTWEPMSETGLMIKLLNTQSHGKYKYRAKVKGSSDSFVESPEVYLIKPSFTAPIIINEPTPNIKLTLMQDNTDALNTELDSILNKAEPLLEYLNAEADGSVKEGEEKTTEEVEASVQSIVDLLKTLETNLTQAQANIVIGSGDANLTVSSDYGANLYFTVHTQVNKVLDYTVELENTKWDSAKSFGDNLWGDQNIAVSFTMATGSHLLNIPYSGNHGTITVNIKYNNEIIATKELITTPPEYNAYEENLFITINNRLNAELAEADAFNRKRNTVSTTVEAIGDLLGAVEVIQIAGAIVSAAETVTNGVAVSYHADLVEAAKQTARNQFKEMEPLIQKSPSGSQDDSSNCELKASEVH